MKLTGSRTVTLGEGVAKRARTEMPESARVLEGRVDGCKGTF